MRAIKLYFFTQPAAFQAVAVVKVHRRADPSISLKGLYSEGGGSSQETQFIPRGKGACAGQLLQQGVANRGHCCSKIRWHHASLPHD